MKYDKIIKRIITAFLCLGVVLMIVSTGMAYAEPLRIIKTVPAGATMEYRINGNIQQSMALSPGTYEITVRDIQQDGAVHARPKRKHQSRME